ncbi:cation:proton antiporter [Gorillibacterium timonense]|uniref:cation:proton antiporter n=1 Tax=Gorillibacterium timonense TaxID=1689269 RepID=UPI00071C605B|nr:cation:proton antiporter [Gorillibacterium timonense]
MLIMQLAIILLASKLAGELSVKLRQPAVLGKLLIGIVLGPAVFGLIQHTDVLAELSQIGVILLMFIAGLETDIDKFKRSGKSSTYVGLAGIAFPFALGYGSGIWFMGLSGMEAAFLGLLLSATSVSISVQSLKELGQLKTREGATIMGAAVIDDVLVIIALAFLMSLSGGDVNLGMIVFKKVAFFGIAILVGWKVVPWLLKRFVNLRVTESVVSAALIICFGLAYFAEYTGVAAIIGAYAAGIAISLTSFKHEVTEKVETIGYAVFVPVFFTLIGVKVSFDGIASQIGLIIGLSVLAIATKLAGAAFGAKAAGFGWRSSLGIGAAMVSRGEVALILAGIGQEAGLLPDLLLTVLVVVVLVTTIVTPLLMKVFFGDSTEPKLSPVQTREDGL